MPEVTRSLRGNKDDTNTRHTYWFNISYYNWFGQLYRHWWEVPPWGRDDELNCSLRFPYFTVPAGAVVTKAHLLLTGYDSSEHPNCHAIISAEDVADPTQITSYDDFMARPRTAQKVDWLNVPPFKEWQAYTSPDISTIVQHLIDTYPTTRSHIQLFIEDNGSDRDARRIFRQGPGYRGNPAQLYIEYNVPYPPIWTPPLQRCSIDNQEDCWEPWSTGYRDNNPWTLSFAAAEYTLEIEDGKLTFSIPHDPWNAISVRHPSGKWPLINSLGQHLWFHARATEAQGDDHFHFTTYILYTRKLPEERVIEPVISHGDNYGPEPLPDIYDDLRTVFFFGLGPDSFDVFEKWHLGRKMAGQSTDPTGWELWMTRIAFERTGEAGYQSIVSDYLDLAYDQPPLPAPPTTLEHWVILTQTEQWSLTGKSFCLTTDVPCHMYLRFQGTSPELHARIKWRRGVPNYNDPGFALKDFDQIEQNEQGDTYTHSFTIDPYPIKDTIYYYFIASIAGGDTKSRSQHFTQKYDPPLPSTLLLDPWTCELGAEPTWSWLYHDYWTGEP